MSSKASKFREHRLQQYLPHGTNSFHNLMKSSRSVSTPFHGTTFTAGYEPEKTRMDIFGEISMVFRTKDGETYKRFIEIPRRSHASEMRIISREIDSIFTSIRERGCL